MAEDVTPFALVVRFTVRPGSEEAFDRLTAEVAAEIREREYDTLVYACHKVEGQPQQRIFYELYRNQAAFKQHKEREHVRRFLGQRAELLESTDVDFLTLQDGKTPPGFQLDAIIAGTQRRLASMRERGRHLSAVVAAFANIDAIRAMVETSESLEAARANVMELLDIDQDRARTVLSLQLQSLSPQRRQMISGEYEQTMTEIADLEAILASPERLREIVGTERGANLARYDERLWARTGDE
jgi:quinol monooxygenase YgiN